MNNKSAASPSSSGGTFVKKLYAMIMNEPDEVVTWINDGTAFHIQNPKTLSDLYLPKYFRHGKFSSLIRQLNFYSFYKVQEGSAVIYQHSFFQRGKPELLHHIKRRGSGKAKDPLINPITYTPFNSTLSSSKIPSSSYPLESPMARPITAGVSVGMSPLHKPGTSNVLSAVSPISLGPASNNITSNNNSHKRKRESTQLFKKLSQNAPPVDVCDFLMNDDTDCSLMTTASLSRNCFIGTELQDDSELYSSAERRQKITFELPISSDDCTLWSKPLSPLNSPLDLNTIISDTPSSSKESTETTSNVSSSSSSWLDTLTASW